MGWVLLDDAFLRHPKVIDLPPAAKLLFVGALCHAGDQMTDGYISAGAARTIAATCGVPASTAKALVSAGLWHKRDGGYDIHDYLDYQRSAEKERRRRASTAARVRTWRQRTTPDTAPVTPDVTPLQPPYDTGTNVVSNAVRTLAPNPIPNPVTSSSSLTHDPPGSHLDDDDPHRQLVHDATLILAGRAMKASSTPVASPAAWLATVRRQRQDHHQAAIDALDLAAFGHAQQLADELEPPAPVQPADRISAASRAREARADAPPCPTCGTRGGRGWLPDTSPAIRCPDCATP